MVWRLARRVLTAALLLLSVPVRAADPPPLEAYGDLPGIEDMAMSPSGGRLAIAGRFNGERRLVVTGGGGKLLATAPLADMKLKYIQWAGEDTVIVVTSTTFSLGYGFTTDKTELTGAIIVPVAGGAAEMVFAKTAAIAKTIRGNYGIRQIDGKWLGYFGGLRYARSADHLSYEFGHGRAYLYEVDLASNRPREIARSAAEGHWRDWQLDDRGQVVATLDFQENSGRWEIINGQRSVIASGVDTTGDVSLVALGFNGDTIIYSTEDDDNGVARWFEVPLAGGTPKEVFANTDLDRVYVDPASGRLLGYLEGGPTPKPVLFDPAQQSVLKRVYKAFPSLDLQIMQWTPSFGHVLVRVSGNGDSGTWYIVDMTKMRADPVAYERRSIGPEQVGSISTVSYKAADGLALDGILTLPPGREARNLPVIMFPHGGPGSHDTETFDWWAQAFASRGYAVFQPNFRGSTNRDLAFRRAGYGQWGRKMQTDISDGLADLVRKGIVDPKRACIMGGSYGGYAALAGVTLQQGLYRCAVAVAPVSDLSDMYWTDYRESGRNKMVQRGLQESLGDPKSFAAVSPRKRASEADAPILLIHGKDDTVVPFKQSEAMASALKSAGKPYELVTLRDEDHWLSRAETRKQMLAEAMRFVQTHNPAD